jgi:hypothetical protein
MGKKRRLRSAKVKFAAKHSHHPRTRFLAQRAQEPEVVEEVKVAEVPLETEKLTPEVILKEEAPKPSAKVTATPPTAKKTTTPRKKKATTPRKRATKKKTTSASA